MEACPRCGDRLDAAAHGILLCEGHGRFLPKAALRREIALDTRYARSAPSSLECPGCDAKMLELRMPVPGSDDVCANTCLACGGWWLDDRDVTQLRAAILARAEWRGHAYALAASVFTLANGA